MHSRLALLATFALTLTASAQEWTRFRGPDGTGLGKADLPDQLTDQNIKWRCALPGTGHSSPVIWGDRIFVTATPDGAVADHARRFVVCVNAKDGKILWQHEFSTGGYKKHADNSFASPSCAVDAERVYAWFAGPDGSQLVALAQDNGKMVWQRDLGTFESQHGPGASPIVEGNEVILQSSQDSAGSFIGAWEASSGKQLWKKDLKGGQHAISTPFVYRAGEAAKKPEIISLSSDNGLVAYDPATGDQRWALADIFKLRCVASPLVLSNGFILAQSGQGQDKSEISVIKDVTGSTPTKAYDIVRTGGYVPTPVSSGGLLWLWKENGFVTCVKADTNDQLWSERVQGPYYASPILVSGPSGTPRIYNVSRAGDLVSIDAADKFRLIQRFPLGEKNSYATPAVSGGMLFVRTYSQLICIGK